MRSIRPLSGSRRQLCLRALSFCAALAALGGAPVLAGAADAAPGHARDALGVFPGLDSIPVLLRLDAAYDSGRREALRPGAVSAKAGILPGDELKLVAGDPSAGSQCATATTVITSG